MAENRSTRVLVVGGGPVGLTAAMDLAQRGVEVLVCELRAPGEPPPVKCNHVSSRSMEIFRRLGIVQRLRSVGLPFDYPNDVAFCTTVTGIEIGRIPIPSQAERQRGVSGLPDTWWPTPEPPYRINQIYLEPALFHCAVEMDNVTILNRTAVEDFSQGPDGVVATARDLDTDETFEIRADYMIGCDGARSTVRRKLGVKLEGLAEITRTLSTHIRAPELIHLIKRKHSWMNHALNPRHVGNAIAIDGKELWLVHVRMPPGKSDFAGMDRDRAIRDVLGVSDDFKYEVLGKEDWIARRLVSDKMRVGRVFIAGDAAHLWIPVAGYGMNCGIADVTDLTWMLGATLNGWAPPSILDAYELERHPITEQVSHFVADLGITLTKKRHDIPSGLEDPGPEGDAVRARYAKELYDLNVAQYCCAGLNFGYFYANSPVIAYDGAEHPGYSMGEFTASTVPGCRAPHVWLRKEHSLYDEFGPYYTLLRRDPSVACDGVLNAAEKAGVPLKLVDAGGKEVAASYDRKLTLIRPDYHVAWRGDEAPEDAVRLIELIRGGQIRSQAGRAAA
jgi:2-polyprenyl-6-methoxyphenol hydroxylase-like FAD-dependent oxidoreductase